MSQTQSSVCLDLNDSIGGVEKKEECSEMRKKKGGGFWG